LEHPLEENLMRKGSSLVVLVLMLSAGPAFAQVMQQPAGLQPVQICLDRLAVTSLNATPFVGLAQPITIAMTINTMGLTYGTTTIPWTMKLNGAPWKSGSVSIASTGSATVAATWTPVDFNSVRIDGFADPDGTLKDCQAGNNTSSVTIGNMSMLDSVTVSPSTIVGGSPTPVVWTINLTAPPPSDPSFKIPVSISTPCTGFSASWIAPVNKATTISCELLTRVSAPTPVTLTAGDPGKTKSATTTAIPYAVSAVTVDPPSNTFIYARVTANGPAPPSGALTFPASSSNPALIPMPSQVSFNANDLIAAVPIPRPPLVSVDTPVTITVGNPGATKSVTTTLKTGALVGLGLQQKDLNNPPPESSALTVTAGKTVAINTHIDMGRPEPTVITLTSSDPLFLPVPPSVTIPATVSPNSQQVAVWAYVDTLAGATTTRTVTITATFGSVSKTAAVTIRSNGPSGVSIGRLPNAAGGNGIPSGSNAYGTLSLLAGAGPGGLTLPITSSRPDILAFPATITVPEGTAGVLFQSTGPAANVSTNVPVTVTIGTAPYAVSATASVDPIGVMTLALNVQEVVAGTTINGTVDLNWPALAGGFTVPLNSTLAAAHVPASVLIPQGATRGIFSITTSAVPADIRGTITAGSGPLVQSKDILIHP
jgi:hypothetical protein